MDFVAKKRVNNIYSLS